MREFVRPHNSIQAQAAIEIAAPPGHVVAVYRDVQKWGDTFPATIESARVTKTGDNWIQIEVAHKKEGRVRIHLSLFPIPRSDYRITLLTKIATQGTTTDELQKDQES